MLKENQLKTLCHTYSKIINEKASHGLGYLKKNKTLDVSTRTSVLTRKLKKSMVGLLDFKDITSTFFFECTAATFLSIILTHICRSFHVHFSSSMPVHRFSSQNPRGAVVFILFLTASIRAELDGTFFKIRKNSFLSDENTLWNGKAASLLSCSQKCVRQATCRSASFTTSEGRCSLHNEKQTKLSHLLLQREHSFYFKKVCCAVLFCFRKGRQLGKLNLIFGPQTLT